jgi:hypothetical protein
MTYKFPPTASMASSYTSSHSAGLVDPSYLSIPDGLKFSGHRTLLRSGENDVGRAGHNKGHDNHSPSRCGTRARRDLCLGDGSQSCHEHPWYGGHPGNPLHPDPGRAHPGRAICCWLSPHASSSDGRCPDLASHLLGEGLGPSL